MQQLALGQRLAAMGMHNLQGVLVLLACAAPERRTIPNVAIVIDLLAGAPRPGHRPRLPGRSVSGDKPQASPIGTVWALWVFAPVRVRRLLGLWPAVVLPASPLRRLLFLSLPLAFAFLERRPLPTRHELSLSPCEAPGGGTGVPAPCMSRQMTRTFWASSPVRRGATSSSTRWPSSRER